MRALLQRVREAKVDVDGGTVGEIGAGVLVFLGLDKHDTLETGERMLERILAYRMFADDAGRMNRSVADIAGGVLLVSQFTLAAETDRGLRPSFSSAMPPAEAAELFAALELRLRQRHPSVASGQFGADMQVSLVNDGPVTFLLNA